MQKHLPQLPIEFDGCARGIVCDISATCFTPHPWSPTGGTCLYSSAYMRAKHAVYELERSMRREAAYQESIEIHLKASLLDHTRNRK